MISSSILVTFFLLTASVLSTPIPGGGLGAEAAGAIAKSTTVAQVGSVAKDPNVPDAMACDSFKKLQA
ncbi:MAG: hypothetical protein M1835_003564, partial [Candelina submexicana]